MATIREKALTLVSRARVELVDQKAGLRRFTVYMRRVTPSDGRGGRGAGQTISDTILTEKPRIRAANGDDVATSAGAIAIGDYLMDRVTPRNDANTLGTTFETLYAHPTTITNPGQQVFVVLVGPGMPAYAAGPPPSGGGEFTVVSGDETRNFGFSFVLRPATGRR